MGNKPSLEDWYDIMDEYEDLCEEFQRVYNDRNVPEANNFTDEVPEYIYLNMEVALPRDGEGPSFSKVTGHLCDANGMPIVTANENTILDTCVYEVYYLGFHKAALEYNTPTENIFA